CYRRTPQAPPQRSPQPTDLPSTERRTEHTSRFNLDPCSGVRHLAFVAPNAERQTPNANWLTGGHALRPRHAVEWIAPAEVVGDRFAGHPAHALMLIDVVDEALVHRQYLGPPTHVGVDGQLVHRVVVVPVDPVKLIAPQLFDVARIDKAVAVRRLLDEHHGRQIVEIPAGRDLDQINLLSSL